MEDNKIFFIDTEKISETAYKGDLSIRKICIGKNVKSIGAEAFSMCSNLESIEVDENNKWFTSGNGCNAIIGKTSGILLVGCFKTKIPESVSEIGPFAFCGQTKLKKITIPSHVHRVSAYAFDGCSDVIELKIEKGVEYIGENCFRNCTNFKTIYLPNTKIDMDTTVFGVAPYNWDEPDNSFSENKNIANPCFEGTINIFFEGTMENIILTVLLSNYTYLVL